MSEPPQAILTYGWPRATTGWRIASDLIPLQGATPEVHTLVEQLEAWAEEGSIRIAGADRILQRRIGGFERFQRLMDAIGRCNAQIFLTIDAFAWAFLRGVKNIDLILPAGNEAMIPREHQWIEQAATVRTQVTQYERLEDTGLDPKLPDDAVTAMEHRQFRKVLLRATARDEIRLLNILLVDGPSTLELVSRNLSLDGGLGEHVIRPFQGAEGRHIVESIDGEWRIRRGAIPWVLFALKRRLGLDLLPLLEGL